MERIHGEGWSGNKYKDGGIQGEGWRGYREKGVEIFSIPSLCSFFNIGLGKVLSTKRRFSKINGRVR